MAQNAGRPDRLGRFVLILALVLFVLLGFVGLTDWPGGFGPFEFFVLLVLLGFLILLGFLDWRGWGRFVLVLLLVFLGFLIFLGFAIRYSPNFGG